MHALTIWGTRYEENMKKPLSQITTCPHLAKALSQTQAFLFSFLAWHLQRYMPNIIIMHELNNETRVKVYEI